MIDVKAKTEHVDILISSFLLAYVRILIPLFTECQNI